MDNEILEFEDDEDNALEDINDLLDIDDTIPEKVSKPIKVAKDKNGRHILKTSRIKVISSEHSRPYTVTDEMRKMINDGQIYSITNITDCEHIDFEGWVWHPLDVEVVSTRKIKNQKPVTFDTTHLDI